MKAWRLVALVASWGVVFAVGYKLQPPIHTRLHPPVAVPVAAVRDPDQYNRRVAAFGAVDRSAPLAMVGDSLTNMGEWGTMLGRPVTSFGINGDTTRGLLDRLSQVIAAKAQTVVLTIGLNDMGWGVPPAEAAGRFAMIVRHLADAHIRTIVYTIPVTGQPFDAAVREYNALIVPLARAAGATVVEFPTSTDPSYFVAPGDVHLSSKGYRAWAASVLTVVPATTSRS